MSNHRSHLKRSLSSKSIRRPGFALLVCLLVAAVSGMAVMAIMNIARFETLEVTAKQRTMAASMATIAGTERGVAMLLSNPNLRGALPTLVLPSGSNATVNINISQAGQNITVTANTSLGGISKTQQTTFTVTQLNQRIASIK